MRIDHNMTLAEFNIIANHHVTKDLTRNAVKLVLFDGLSYRAAENEVYGKVKNCVRDASLRVLDLNRNYRLYSQIKNIKCK